MRLYSVIAGINAAAIVTWANLAFHDSSQVNVLFLSLHAALLTWSVLNAIAEGRA